MSAFVVATDHIDFLVSAGIEYQVIYYPGRLSEGGPTSSVRATRETADRIGMILLAENAASVSHRYSHRDDLSPDELGETAVFYSHRAVRIDALGTGPVDILKAITCLEYQSCEHPGWEASDAAEYLRALQQKAIGRLLGYESAQWEWTREAQARQLEAVRAATLAKIEKARAACAAETARLSVVRESVPPESVAPVANDRDQAIKTIRAALKRRSGKAWSVTGGRGTSWGWITITAPPKRCVNGSMSEADAAELGELLGLGRPVHHQGQDIPSGGNYRAEYLARAEGKSPERIGTPYWD